MVQMVCQVSMVQMGCQVVYREQTVRMARRGFKV